MQGLLHVFDFLSSSSLRGRNCALTRSSFRFLHLLYPKITLPSCMALVVLDTLSVSQFFFSASLITICLLLLSCSLAKTSSLLRFLRLCPQTGILLRSISFCKIKVSIGLDPTGDQKDFNLKDRLSKGSCPSSSVAKKLRLRSLGTTPVIRVREQMFLSKTRVEIVQVFSYGAKLWFPGGRREI